jgi:hypothetical protein
MALTMPRAWCSGINREFMMLNSLDLKVDWLMALTPARAARLDPEATTFHIELQHINDLMTPLTQIAEARQHTHCDYFGKYWILCIHMINHILGTAVLVWQYKRSAFLLKTFFPKIIQRNTKRIPTTK